MQTNLIKLNKELGAVRLEKDELAKKMSVDTDKIKNLEEENKKLQETITNLKKEETSIMIDLSDSVNEKVIQNLASLGVKEGTVSDDVVVTPTSTTDPMEIYKKYEMLTGKEKINFFKQNERSIMNAMKIVHYMKLPVYSTNNNLGKE